MLIKHSIFQMQQILYQLNFSFLNMFHSTDDMSLKTDLLYVHINHLLPLIFTWSRFKDVIYMRMWKLICFFESI